jgi:2-polyprenyl-3-methyl-5-hydroxy-6-metoxy-1,4-benzoquinol methylase
MSDHLLTRDDFDAALVPGFREATRAEYRALDRAWGETSSTVLDGAGRFVPGADFERDCPLCGAPAARSTPLFEKLGMKIVACPDCGLTYSRNVLTEEFDRQLYIDSASQTGYQDLKRNEAYASLERVKCRYIVQRLEDFHAAPGRLLDIGPGSGRLLESATQAGWDALGIEANARFAAACRERGIRVVEGFFPDVLPAKEQFDAIALLDVIEHLHQPLELLRTAASRLAAGGVLVVQVPNVDSLLVQLEGARNTNFCHGHWSHFNLKTLEKLGRGAGLVPLALETIITEIDRIRAFPAAAVAATARRVAGVEPPADFDSQWLHAHGLGYKALAFFRAAAHG